MSPILDSTPPSPFQKPGQGGYDPLQAFSGGHSGSRFCQGASRTGYATERHLAF